MSSITASRFEAFASLFPLTLPSLFYFLLSRNLFLLPAACFLGSGFGIKLVAIVSSSNYTIR
jgi:hypothetical protein